MARRLLVILLLMQALTHLFWLSPAAHSGQLAIPWLMNNELRLFDEILEQHAPGSSWLVAVALRLTGMAPALLIRLLDTALILAFTALVHILASALARSSLAGLLAALVWAWWAPVYANVMLYFDALLAFCVLGALCLYYARSGALTTRRFFAIGLLLGAATLFKQQAWLALGLMLLWLLIREGRRGALITAVAALLLPAAQWALLLAEGAFDAYVYWNWTFNLSGLMDGAPLDGDLFRKLLLSNMLVLPFALLAWRGAGRRQVCLVLMWCASLVLLFPRFGEIHAMGHLALTAAMSGVVLARAWRGMGAWRAWDATRVTLAGLALGIGLGWLWTGAASLLHLPLGPGATLGHDEFAELAAELKARKDDGDTLFVLPETDSTPQLHPLTEMLPPGAWVKGWHWYFRAEGILERLKAEWAEEPPSWIVVFPELIINSQLGMADLLDIVAERYALATVVDELYGHGRAEIHRLAEA